MAPCVCLGDYTTSDWKFFLFFQADRGSQEDFPDLQCMMLCSFYGCGKIALDFVKVYCFFVYLSSL